MSCSPLLAYGCRTNTSQMFAMLAFVLRMPKVVTAARSVSCFVCRMLPWAMRGSTVVNHAAQAVPHVSTALRGVQIALRVLRVPRAVGAARFVSGCLSRVLPWATRGSKIEAPTVASHASFHGMRGAASSVFSMVFETARSETAAAALRQEERDAQMM